MSDAKKQVIERLLSQARLIRRKGSPDEADAVLPYERLLAHDLAELTAQKEFSLPKVKPEPEPAHA